jgi:heme-degrading monooxygenase HmoA
MFQMYGTVARIRVAPGKDAEFARLSHRHNDLGIPGFVATYLYRTDADPSEYYMAVIFADRDSYIRNAEDPEQDRRYREMRALLAADPEWHDGEVVATE